MIRYWCTNYNPALKWHRFFCHSNIDYLVRLNTLMVTCENADTLNDLQTRFSNILNDIQIGTTWKRTEANRLIKTEEAIVEFISHINIAEALQILDIGASDGSTTLHLFKAVQSKCRHKVKVFLGDKHLAVTPFSRRYIVEYRYVTEEPIMLRVGRLSLRLYQSSGKVSRWFNFIVKWYLSCHNFRRKMISQPAIPLISNVITRETSIVLIEMDILQWNKGLANKFDIVRVSNLLNINCFNPQQLRAAISYIHSYLREGGILVISRNIGLPGQEIEHGSVWMGSNDGFVHVKDFGNGSEVKEYADQFNANNESSNLIS